jgi:hypothetical protein
MVKQKFIPELHDIGKLVDSKVKDNVEEQIGRSWKGHVFINFDFQSFGISQPTSPSWWGQYHHETSEVSKDINQWNLMDTNGNTIPPKEKYHLFLLILADHLASSVSRATLELGRKKAKQEGVLKLWKKGFYQKEQKKGRYWAAFKTVDDLKTVFNEIQNCQSGEEFLHKYKKNLLLTPEDKSVPRNVTSLYTHVELVGKIYRVLEKNTKLITEPDGTISIEYENGKKVKTIKEAEGDNFIYFKNKNKEYFGTNKGKWQARLVKCWIKFPHSFVRLRDINLLRKREELVNCIASYYKDEVIFATSDFITLFLPPNQDLKEIFNPLLDWGFYIEVEETLADLGILNSILDWKTLQARKSNDKQRLQVLNNRSTKIYKKYLMPEMPEEIQPPICDICQQRRGIERPKENIREWICDKCQEIRDFGEPFDEYGDVWEKEGVKVCWFKFSLDQNKLETWLQNTFEEYIDSHNLRNANILKDEFRPLALQVDINKDYKKMLKEFWKEFKKVEDIEKPIRDYDELGVFKFSPDLAKKVIDKFLVLSDEYFPDCASDENSPISLSLSVANIKYPIRDHWRFFEEGNKNFFNVRYHKVFDEKYTKDELKNIIEVIDTETSSSFLHKLAELENSINSDIYIAVEIFNNRKRYPEVYELFSKEIKPSKFLNLYRLLRG